MKTLPEIQQIENKIQSLDKVARVEILARSQFQDLDFPIYKISIGNPSPTAPVLGFTGGVHGLERIGSQVCLAFLNSILELAQWDENMQATLQKVRLFFIPTVNPIGIYNKTRSNPRGVDLMRNAPVEAQHPARWVGGHRSSRHLPWYRGEAGAAMEVEAQALISGVQKEIQNSPLAVTLDIHSGFGMQDRLWFPYAKTTEAFPDVGMAYTLKQLLDRTYPHHFYKVEPQAQSYTTHGDLWDYVYDLHLQDRPGQKYLPLCLEMGSWLWVKKNPWQILRADGPFNPMKTHRKERILRRHNTLLEFLIRAISSSQAWVHQDSNLVQESQRRAKELWYASPS